MKRLAVILLLLLAAPAFGGWPDSRVVFMEDGGTGSFVEIGGKAVIVSCAHRTNTTHVDKGDRVGFTCHDGSRGTATVIAVAPFDLDSQIVQDCAVYDVGGALAPRYKRFRFASAPAKPGEKVWVCGFPIPSQCFSCRTTAVVEDNGTLWIQGTSTPGESGGPIVNARGEIVGTLTATTSEGRSFCCSSVTEAAFCQTMQLDWAGGSTGGQPGRAPAPSTPLPAAPIAVPSTPVPAPAPVAQCGKCGCAEKFVAIEARLASIENEIALIKNRKCNAEPATLNFIGVNNKVVATATITPGLASSVTLPPINMRILDQRGPEFSTEYQPASLGSFVTLPFGPAQP